MFIAGLSFAVAGVVQMQVQGAEQTLQPHQAKAVVTNTLPYSVDMRIMQGTELMFNDTLQFGEVRACIIHSLLAVVALF